MKPTYTISCINETQDLDQIERVANLFISSVHFWNISNEQLLWETEKMIELMKKNILLLIESEISLINQKTEHNPIGYALLWLPENGNNDYEYEDNSYCIREVYIAPKRRKQWAWTLMMQYIITHLWQTKNVVASIAKQEAYNQICLDYDAVYNRKIPSINRKKLIEFLQKQWFDFWNILIQQRFGRWEYIQWIYKSPTTTPPIDADTWSSYDQ